jgi:hypothetical protein
MLYLFFALEAIVGDRSEGLKGEKLALRRAILSHLTTGNFSHPARAYVLYEEVRNKAVHGSELTVPVTEDEVRNFSYDVRAGASPHHETNRAVPGSRTVDDASERGDRQRVGDEKLGCGVLATAGLKRRGDQQTVAWSGSDLGGGLRWSCRWCAGRFGACWSWSCSS